MPPIHIEGRFVYTDPNCNNGGTTDAGCTFYVEIIDKDSAWVLPGGDIVYEYN